MKLRSLALAALLFAGLPLASSTAFVGISVGFAPPPLPVYVQPPCPVEGYIWTPGYWAYGDVGYYWVPGVWVAPPRVGVYWTPGYWGYSGGSYVFNTGYWGPSVGFYGGINYGFGYGGVGYYGGEWAGGAFRYNTAVTRVNTSIVHNTYINKTVINNYGGGKRRASFNGPGGINRQPTPQERAAASAEHVAPTPEQSKVEQAAAKNPDLHAAKNHGHPKVAAIKTPGEIAQQPGAGAAAADKAGRKGENAANGANDAQATTAAGADKPGRKGANARNNGNDAQPATAGAGRGANKKAAAQSNGGANRHGAKAANAREHAATAMPAQAHEPRIPQAAQRHGRAVDAIANRGPQHRAQASMQRPVRSARVQAAPARPAAGDQRAVAPNKRKRPNAPAPR